jgi:hypothetical protein
MDFDAPTPTVLLSQPLQRSCSALVHFHEDIAGKRMWDFKGHPRGTADVLSLIGVPSLEVTGISKHVDGGFDW